MLRIENIAKSILAPSFLTNSKVDMIRFVNPYKMLARSAFLAFLSAWNGGELEGG
jgi:hypothetical protein